MHDAVRAMLERHECATRDDYVGALREILQELALLGLWRGKFFERAAFYGGTALRVLYGLDRYSEDLDFSLLTPDAHFSLGAYGESLVRELRSFGFDVHFQSRGTSRQGAIESAFLKTNTYRHLLAIDVKHELLSGLHPAATLKIKLEVDTDPPGGFSTGSKYLLRPIPVALRVYSLPDLFAGKLHAVLFRKWKNRVKGRDWYDLVWFASWHPEFRLSHLEARMRQSGDFQQEEPLTFAELREMLQAAVHGLDVAKVRQDVLPF
ncbi:MAG: nucleotidyl transferase AbiEii/AbiGii toxin family protein, partial [Patescibacteria group bacterium]|nr:nucleotidyl transferase AbiEii/AbiGii toxin family protein [Patescibacteria group bacterium]